MTLLDSTVRASLAFATKKVQRLAWHRPRLPTLARGVLHTMMISKFKVIGTLTLAGILALGGVRTVAHQFGAATAESQTAAVPETNERQSSLLRSVNRIDDLLDDIERRNRDVQTELRALRQEIVALRSDDRRRQHQRHSGKLIGVRRSEACPETIRNRFPAYRPTDEEC